MSMFMCERHGYEVVLDSVCCTDASSDHPVCLFKPTEAGGVVVLDVEAAEAAATNFDEPDLALFLVSSALGLDQNVVGQYVSPARDEKEFRNEVDELGQRYPALVVHGGRAVMADSVPSPGGRLPVSPE